MLLGVLWSGQNPLTTDRLVHHVAAGRSRLSIVRSIPDRVGHVEGGDLAVGRDQQKRAGRSRGKDPLDHGAHPLTGDLVTIRPRATSTTQTRPPRRPAAAHFPSVRTDRESQCWTSDGNATVQ